MEEPEDASAPSPDGGGGITSFITSVRGLIAAAGTLVFAVVALIGVLREVGVLGDDGDGAARTTTRPNGATEPKATTLFGPITRPNGRVYFDQETMYVTASRPARPLLHLADFEESLREVAMSARVRWVSGARDFGIGFVCRYQNAANYYLLSILSGGRYNIVKYRNGRGVSLLGRIRESPAITDNENDIQARCVGGEVTTLTLTVNGREIEVVTDKDAIESGTVGVRVGSSESFVTCTFDDFSLKYI
jgi:hypothetical protein